MSLHQLPSLSGFLLHQNIGLTVHSMDFLLLPMQEADVTLIIQNLVALIGLIQTSGVKIPKEYPRPLSSLLGQSFLRIKEAGGVIKMKQPPEENYRDITDGEEERFLGICHEIRFSLTGEGGQLLIATITRV